MVICWQRGAKNDLHMVQVVLEKRSLNEFLSYVHHDYYYYYYYVRIMALFPGQPG